MNLPSELPNDVQELKKLLIQTAQQSEEKITQLENRVKERELAILELKEMFLKLQRKEFGRKSEKFKEDERQGYIFNEIELGLHDEKELFNAHEDEPTTVKSHTRNKTGRKKLPDHLERKDVFHDISESEKNCDCGHKLADIGEEISEEIVIKPPQVYVNRHIRKIYACSNCKGDERNEAGNIVVTSPFNDPRIFPGSNLSVDTLVFLITSKFMDSIPFHRISEMLLRIKIQIPRGTLCNWVNGVYLKYRDILGFFPELVQTGGLIGIDETSYQVHKEKGRKNTSKSYMWVMRGGEYNKPIINYAYRKTRSALFLKDLLINYKGAIQTDGFETYNTHFKNNPDVIHAGCVAHARRKFEEIYKLNKDDVCEKVLYNFRKLYAIEDKIRKKDLYKKGLMDEIVQIRQKEAKPILDYLHTYLSQIILTIPRTIGVGKAISYTLNEWDKLIKYIDNGYIYIDNNNVENSIRPFVLGRKNWLFSDVPEGAEASAFYFSLLQTFKANGLNPYEASMKFFKSLPNCKNQDDARDLFFGILG
jgi:transposase